MNISPGIIAVSLSDRLVHRHELGAVGKRRLDLNLMDHLGNAVHHLLAREHVGAGFHQLGDGPAVARALDDEVGDQRHRLRVIELDPALEPPASYHGRHGDQQLVLFARGEVHALPSTLQFSQSRGNDAPRRTVSTAMRSWRSAAPSAAQSRATAKPFHIDTPTSPRKLTSARTAAATVSSAGAANTVA